MAVPASILEAKSRPVRPEVDQNGHTSIPLPIVEAVAPTTPFDVEHADIALRAVEWVPLEWIGIGLLSSWLSFMPHDWSNPAWVLVLTIAIGWTKSVTRKSVIWYVKKFRPLVEAHARGRCSEKEIEYRRSLCNRCTYRYQHKGKNYCKAMQTSCKCGHWLASSLEWLTTRANWECKLKFFVKETNESSWMIAERQKKERSNGNQ